VKIVFDTNGYVAGYANEGFDIDGGEEFVGIIPEGFNAETCRFYYRDGDTLRLDETKRQAAQDAEAAQDELMELYAWFEWYDIQVHQALRAERMNEAFSAEDSSGQTYESLEDLDTQAAVYQVRIREIREGVV
jgi:hypothetical protein